MISPELYRGFSGEGTLLTLLSRPEAESFGRRLLPQLHWSPVIDPDELATCSAAPADDVEAGLAWLAASGRLGWDIVEQAWFHRDLPIDSEQVLRRNPRLVSAHALAAGGGVAAETDGWTVRGKQREQHRVTNQLTCDCAWYREHRGDRGPCKHVLAVLIDTADDRPL